MAFPWKQSSAGPSGAGMEGVASAWCELGVTCYLGSQTTAHRAKRASSDRSGFFRPEGLEELEGGAGPSVGGEGRLGTISAALALSSRNLSNSAIQNQNKNRISRQLVPNNHAFLFSTVLFFTFVLSEGT